MKRRAAPGENNATDIAQLCRSHVQPAQLGRAFVEVEPSPHGVTHGVWLLENFLKHIMGELALAHFFRAELDFADLVITDLARERADLECVARDGDNIEVVKVNGVAGVGDNRAHVAGEKIFIAPNAEYERAAPPGADNEVFDVGMDERNSIGANDLLERGAGGVHKTRLRISAIEL